MTVVHLHGALGKTYGRRLVLGIETPGEAVRCLSANFPGFTRDIANGSWRVVIGSKTVQGGITLDPEMIPNFRIGKSELHIVPVLQGAKSAQARGATKAVLGIALIGLSFGFAAAPLMTTTIAPSLFGAMTFGNAAGMIGMSLALSGLSTLLAPEKKTDEDAKSYISSGPTSIAREGVIVPIVYGKTRVGGLMVSGGVRIDDTQV